MFKLRELTLGDKDVIDAHISAKEHSLSAYSFANIYIWRDFFRIKWAQEGKNVIVFFQQEAGMFLYLMPLGPGFDLKQWRQLGRFLSDNSSAGFPARVDNVEADEANELIGMGFKAEERGNEYIYSRASLVSLRGDRFKSKRSALNQFARNVHAVYRPYKGTDLKQACLLLDEWAKERRDDSRGEMYNYMIDDAAQYHRRIFKEHKELGLCGRVVEMNGAVCAYTFGFRLNRDTFCVLTEVASRSVKGLAQFIFRELCRERTERFINVMDDCGQENMRRVKLSYRPENTEKNITVLLR